VFEATLEFAERLISHRHQDGRAFSFIELSNHPETVNFLPVVVLVDVIGNEQKLGSSLL
jgi:hypothetical protein